MNLEARPPLPIDTADARACMALIAGLPPTNAREAQLHLGQLLNQGPDFERVTYTRL